MRRARERASQADLTLWVVDASDSDPTAPPTDSCEQSPETWVVFNKCDIAQRDRADGPKWLRRHRCLAISAKTGESFDKLLVMLEEFLVDTFVTNEFVLITRERHRHLLSNCHQALKRALGEPLGREDIIAEELHLAARDLGRLTGRVDVEDVLDVIFRDFCIGK